MEQEALFMATLPLGTPEKALLKVAASRRSPAVDRRGHTVVAVTQGFKLIRFETEQSEALETYCSPLCLCGRLYEKTTVKGFRETWVCKYPIPLAAVMTSGQSPQSLFLEKLCVPV